MTDFHLTVVMPAHNAERTIAAAIQSIIVSKLPGLRTVGARKQLDGSSGRSGKGLSRPKGESISVRTIEKFINGALYFEIGFFA